MRYIVFFQEIFKSKIKTAVFIFLFSLAIYHINGKPIAQVDCVPAPYTAWAIATKLDFDLSGYNNLSKHVGGVIYERPDGKWITCYPPGSAISALPFLLPIAVFHKEPLKSSKMRLLGKIVASVYVSASVVLFYFICSVFLSSRSIMATILFAFGTCMYSSASQALWMHGPAVFWLMTGLFLILKNNGNSSVTIFAAAGLSFGLAFITRPTTIIFASFFILALITDKKYKQAYVISIIVSIMVLLFVLYNKFYFGCNISGGYGQVESYWTTPLALGITGLLIAPSRGLLVYSPAFILVPLGIWGVLKYRRGFSRYNFVILLSLLISSVSTFLLFAKWHCWWGAWCFGPRLLCEITPALSIFFALAVGYFEKVRKTAVFLVILSVFAHLLGVFGSGGDWNERFNVGAYGKNLFSFKDTQIESHIKQLLINLRIIHRGKDQQK